MIANKVSTIFLCIFLTGCFSKEIVKPDVKISAQDKAKCDARVPLTLPDPIDFTLYKVDQGQFVMFTKGDKTYVGVPEYNFWTMQQTLLVLKNRIFTLQEIILDSNK